MYAHRRAGSVFTPNEAGGRLVPPWDCYGFLASKELDRGRMPSAAAHGLDAATVELARTAAERGYALGTDRLDDRHDVGGEARPPAEVWSRALERLLHDPDVELPG
jgi:hypothetical protein